jgi:hypothetical protein
MQEEEWVRKMADIEDQCGSISARNPDLFAPVKPMKMYILILDNIPIGHAINSAAHASLACYLRFQATPEMTQWVTSSFKKVTCRVTQQELETAIGFVPEHVVITESNLPSEDGKPSVMGAAFAPREAWDPFFKTLALLK